MGHVGTINIMPIDPKTYTTPSAQSFKPVPPGMYQVSVKDCTFEEKLSDKYKDKEGNFKLVQKYIFELTVTDGPEKDNSLRSFLTASLRPPKEVTKPSLAKMLKAITGEDWNESRMPELTAEFMNSLIGLELKVVTDVTKTQDGTKEYAIVTQFMAK